jgi:hypothetical protein
MVKRKAASSLPPYRRFIPHPVGLGKDVANSSIDCRDKGARGERPKGDKPRIAIAKRKSMLGAPIGQPDSCNRMGWDILVGAHRREGYVLRVESIMHILVLGVHKA